MKDPVRLLDEGASVDEFERGLLGSARTDVGPERTLDRMLVALGATATVTVGAAASANAASAVGVAGAVGKSIGGSLATGASAASSALTVKWIVFGALAGFATAGGLFAAESAFAPGYDAPSSALSAPTGTADGSRAAPPRIEASPPRDERSEPEAPGASSSSANGAAPAAPPGQPSDGASTDRGRLERSAKAEASLPAPTATASAPELMAEVAALDRARAALASRQPSAALAELDRYGHDFPKGALAPEATVLRIDALLQAGDRASATALAKPFLDGSSPHASRVRAMFERSTPTPTNR